MQNNPDPFAAPTNNASTAPSTAEQQQQRYYAYYVQQRQQQQYAQYYQALLKQRQQHQYAHYYRQIAQQYGYPAMIQAMNNDTVQHQQQQQALQSYYQSTQAQPVQAALNNSHSSPRRRANGTIILSAEEQPLLMAAERSASKQRKKRSTTTTNTSTARRGRKRKRKKPDSDDEEEATADREQEKSEESERSGGSKEEYTRNETVSLDIEEADDLLLGLDKNGYDRHTLINQNECLPDIHEQFDEWLYFSKKLWKRQKKYKHLVVDQQRGGIDARGMVDVSETISTSESPTQNVAEPPLHLKSVFMKDRARLKRKQGNKGNVLHKANVVNVMIAMGLAPPWTQMLKYKKWKKCYKKCYHQIAPKKR